MQFLANGLNRLLTGFFDLLFVPLRFLGLFWSLTVFSLVTGLLMLWIFGRVSNQKKIRHVKGKIQGNLIAIRLFQSNLPVFLRIQGRIFRDTFVYMRYSLTPMLIMIVPVLFILIQLNWRYSVRPLQTGEAAVLKVILSDGALLEDPAAVSLESGDGVVVETAPVRIPLHGEAAWRIRAVKEGVHELAVHVGGETVIKTVAVGAPGRMLSALRPGSDLSDILLNPGETPIRSTSVQSVNIEYPPMEISFLGWSIHWLVYFFILSVAFGYLTKGLFGIEV
jgi:uncharacterized membrane protein (DUF106 family)